MNEVQCIKILYQVSRCPMRGIMLVLIQLCLRVLALLVGNRLKS